MMLFTEDMKIGVPHIDRQHKELVDSVNKLSSLGLTNPSKEEIKKYLDFLGDFVLPRGPAAAGFCHALAPNSLRLNSGRLRLRQNQLHSLHLFYLTNLYKLIKQAAPACKGCKNLLYCSQTNRLFEVGDNTLINMVAPCSMGLESVVSQELKFLNMQSVKAEDRRVFFQGEISDIARANINLRAADRVLIVLGRFTAKTFDDLFESVKALPLENFIGSKDAFPVKGISLQSALHNVPSCQAIVKKAVATRLGTIYKQQWLKESGPIKQLQFLILKDDVTLMLDTSGDNLHKRGYRPFVIEAPIRETLAAGIINVARLWHKNMLLDPMCGSGTFLIESALMAKKIAPGIKRGFAAEKFDGAFGGEKNIATLFAMERERARSLEKNDADFQAFGWDIDPSAVELTRQNAIRAGVQEAVHVECRELKAFSHSYENACVVTNPPYGERLLDIEQARAIYKLLGKVVPQGNISVITPDREFEKLFGRKADKRRKLYNGKIECQLYMYY